MFLNHYKSKQSSLRRQDMYFGPRLAAFLGAALLLKACVIYPHTVPVNPSFEGNLISAEDGAPIADAGITLHIYSDISRTYSTTSDKAGRFAFANHSDYRLIAMLADAPLCATTLTIKASGYKARTCTWGSMRWCSGQPMPAFANIPLIPKHSTSEYRTRSASGIPACDGMY
jgi:hypothetical protein